MNNHNKMESNSVIPKPGQSSLGRSHENEEIMSILVNKVVEKEGLDEESKFANDKPNSIIKNQSLSNKSFREKPKYSPPNISTDWDKLINFKKIKVKNRIIPTYKMKKSEGKKVRKKMQEDALNEMDSIIQKTIDNDPIDMINKRKLRNSSTKPDKSSDSTSDRSSNGNGGVSFRK